MQRTMMLAAATALAMSGSAFASAPGEGQTRQREHDSERRKATASIPRSVVPNRPGETNRQFAARVRAEAAAAETSDVPTKPKRVRAKKAAA